MQNTNVPPEVPPEVPTYITNVVKNLPENIEIRGREIYRNNQTFRDIANVMEHPMFNEFFNKYFTNEFDAAAMFSMMQIYNRLDKIYNIELTPYKKITLLNYIMQNKFTRDRILNGGPLRDLPAIGPK